MEDKKQSAPTQMMTSMFEDNREGVLIEQDPELDIHTSMEEEINEQCNGNIIAMAEQAIRMNPINDSPLWMFFGTKARVLSKVISNVGDFEPDSKYWTVRDLLPKYGNMIAKEDKETYRVENCIKNTGINNILSKVLNVLVESGSIEVAKCEDILGSYILKVKNLVHNETVISMCGNEPFRSRNLGSLPREDEYMFRNSFIFNYERRCSIALLDDGEPLLAIWVDASSDGSKGGRSTRIAINPYKCARALDSSAFISPSEDKVYIDELNKYEVASKICELMERG